MSRYKIILEGEFEDDDNAVAVYHKVALRLEDIGDVRVVKVTECLAGCLVCQHGEPVDRTYSRVMCHSKGMEHVREPLDSCMRFVRLDVMDKQVLGDSALAAEVAKRIDKFNRLVAKDE